MDQNVSPLTGRIGFEGSKKMKLLNEILAGQLRI